MKTTHKGGILLFLAFVGVGYLGGLTGTVATAPKYSGTPEQKPALVYNTGVQPAGQSADAATPVDQPVNSTAQGTQATTVALDTSVFSNKGCIQCHTISGINVTGGATGPDLTNAINNVPNKYGKSLREFLDAPEGVMSEVLPTKKVTDPEKEKIVELLTKAAEQQGSTV